ALKTGIVIIPSSEMLKTNDLQYRIRHGEVRGIVSYFPYVDQYKGIKEYDDLLKFVVGGDKEGWHNLDQLKAAAGDELEMADTRKEDIVFLPYIYCKYVNHNGDV